MAIGSHTQCQKCGLYKSSIFADLSPEHWAELEKSRTVVRYKPQQVIFHEGHQPFGLYCLSAGKVKIYTTSDGTADPQIVRLSGPGDILGFLALISGNPYTSTAEALEDTDVCFIDKQTFFHFLEESPQTSRHVMSVLAKEVQWLESQRVSLVQKRVRSRLAETFVMLQDKFGKKDPAGTRLNIDLTRQELAEMIGTTPESVIRTIAEFKQSGYISTDGSYITILDTREIAKIANTTD